MLQTTTYKETPNFFGVDYTKKGIATKVRINYTTFGSPMPGRNYTSSSYRYGFNGQEKDDEVKGNGNSLDFGERIYDPRLGRFLSVDALTSSFPFFSPYQYAGNTPIQAIDLDGLEPEFIVDKQGKLTKPMMALFNAAFAYDMVTMQNTTWKKSTTSTYNAQTIYHTIWMGSKSEQGNKSTEEWTDYWFNLSVHEHKHRSEYKGLASWLGWGISYGVQLLMDGFYYSDKLPTESRAYGIEQPMVDVMNFQGGLALKTLESSFDESVKVGIMNYVGAAYNLGVMQGQLENFNGSDRKKAKLEKKIANQTSLVNDLKEKYSSQIGELDQKQGREVKLITTPTERKSIFKGLFKKKEGNDK